MSRGWQRRDPHALPRHSNGLRREWSGKPSRPWKSRKPGKGGLAMARRAAERAAARAEAAGRAERQRRARERDARGREGGDYPW